MNMCQKKKKLECIPSWRETENYAGLKGELLKDERRMDSFVRNENWNTGKEETLTQPDECVAENK